MNAPEAIPLVSLLASPILLLIPGTLLVFFRVRMLKDFVIAVCRMALQLSLVGLYLGFVFEADRWYVTLAWAVLAVMLSACEAIRRSKLDWREMFLPISGMLFISLGMSVAFVMLCVVGEVPFADARVTIPLCGSYLGIGIKGLIISMRSFRRAVKEGEKRIEYAFALGARPSEAYRQAVRHALGDAFAPLIANMSMMGLIVLPGALTGAVVGGASIRMAVEWQWLMMIGNATVSTLTCALTLAYLVRRGSGLVRCK